MGVLRAEHVFGQVVEVRHGGHGHNGIHAQVGADDQGLRVVVADDADAAGAAHSHDVRLKFRAKLCVGNVMDVTLDVAAVPDGQSSASGPQVRMIVGPIEQIGDAVVSRSNPEKTTHLAPFSMTFECDLGLRSPAKGSASRISRRGAGTSDTILQLDLNLETGTERTISMSFTNRREMQVFRSGSDFQVSRMASRLRI